jgi:hypothetical protein
LKAEPIQRVDHVEIFAVGDTNRAVRVREVHPASRVVPVIRDREDVRWEGRRFRMVKVKQSVDGAV